MRKLMLGVIAAAAGGLGTVAVANAGPLSIGPFDGMQAPIVQVADGCGPGFHRNPWGRCRPNGSYGYGPPPYGPPRGYGYDRGYDRPPPRPVYRYGY